MPQTILGIDVGSFSIKIAEVERSFNTYELVRFYERKIQYNELLKPEESIAVTLQGMIDDFGLRWDQIICGYPGQKISSRLLTLPFGNLRKIDQTIEFELEGFIPFDLENLVIDYHLLSTTKESSDVLVFYTLKEDFANWLKLFQSSQMDPKVITVEASEFLNLVYLGMVPPENPYVIIDIGHSKTNVTLCKGKVLHFVRSIPFGGKNITERIRKKLDLPFEEAERLKIEVGSLPLEGSEESYDHLSGQVSAAMKEAIQEWLLSLKQVLFAYKEQESEPLGGVYLCGGSSRIPNLDRTLSVHLKQNVTHIDPTSFHFTHLGPVSSHRATMAQGLALALRGVAARKMPSLNLRQGEFAYKGDMEQLGGTLRHVGIALGLILLMGLTYFGIDYFVLSKQVSQFNEQITKMVRDSLGEDAPKTLSSPGSALKLIKSKKSSSEKRVQDILGIEGVSVLQILKDISQKVPGREDIRLDIEELSLKGDRVSLKGIADSFIAVDKIKAALEDSVYLAGVTPGSTRKGVSEDEYKFEMTMDLEVAGKAKKPKKKEKAKGRKKGS